MRTLWALLFSLILALPTLAAPPPLPSGLGQKPEEKKDQPPLPPGLGGAAAEKQEPKKGADALSGLLIEGFAETRAGLRLRSDPNQKATSIGELRLQLGLEKELGFATATVVGDFLFDPVMSEHGISLERGDGWFDLREANVLMRPAAFMDLKLGRQILTWGTGDLLFINDLFPKDWNAFFIGRDEEYLKAPSDVFKLSLYSSVANLDIVYTPRFDTDRFIDGRRVSYYSPAAGAVVGRNAIVQADRPSDWFGDDEFALRLYRNLGTAEVALYYYDGFWKSPAGQDAATGFATFPRLRSIGASVRRPFLGGIANLEVGYYDSLDDPDGSNVFIGNSEFRLLAGFEKEIASELTGGFQYYLERMQDYDAYVATLPFGMPVRDRSRHVLTARLTKLAMSQNLTLSMFAYWSPSDADGYLRPKASYKIDDAWRAEVGANVFFGKANHTFFGQFERTSNAFLALRRSF